MPDDIEHAASGATARAFVAATLPLATVRRIADAQRALAAETERRGWRVGWVSPAQMHVTLKFLGGIRRERIEAIELKLRQALAAVSAPSIEVAGAGAFPSPERPSVLWVGAGPGLNPLAETVETVLADLGYAREARPFHAHVTIARVITRAASGAHPETRAASGAHPDSQGGAAELLAPLSGQKFGTCWIDEVVVYESRTHRAGAEYLPLARIPLNVKGKRDG